MTLNSSAHPTLDDLEYYSLNRHGNPLSTESIEEHLLICKSCRCDLEDVEQQIRVLKIALRQSQAPVVSLLVH